LEFEQNFDEENELLFLRTNEKPQKFQNYYKNNGFENTNNKNINNINNNGFNNRYEEESNIIQEQNDNNPK
jgi:hypothetical protein